jgi:two-component system, sensor histidine kinase
MNKILLLFNKILLLATAYFVTGKLGLMLAVPPGYATAIWPPSGIALAGIIVFGWRAWPGILLGSFLVNVSLDSSSILTAIFSLGIPLIIGTGAALQAVIGAILVRRFASFPNDLAHVNEVFTFLFWGALVSCLVNATISVTTLMLSGKITVSNFLFNWWTWWLGDVIGVLIFTPLVLVWVLKPRHKWRTRRLFVTLPIVTTFLLTLIAVNLGTSWEIKQLEFQFNQHASNLARAFEKNLLSHIEVLHSLKSFYLATTHITREDFKIFVKRPFTDLKGLQALSWNPLVDDKNREQFEQTVQQKGLTHFQITERKANGKLVRASPRPNYVTVYYIEPFTTNSKALGFDVASNPVRRKALELARDTGELISTARITLVQETGQQFGILFFLPIYKKGSVHDTLEKRRQNLVGYMVGVFRTGDLVEEALQDLDRKGLLYQLLDKTAPIEKQPLFNSHDSQTADINRLLKQYLLSWATKQLKANFPFVVGQRTWHFQVIPTQEYVAKYRQENAWLILVMGLLLSGIVGIFVLVLSGRDVLLQHLVEKRTMELKSNQKRYEEKNRLLEQEIVVRKRAEKAAEVANQAKSTFLANMSHEIRTPMNAVIGFSEILASEITDKKQKSYLNSIQMASKNLLTLINDILDLSKIEAGRLNIQYEPVNLQMILTELQQIFNLKMAEKQLEFIMEIDETLPQFLCLDETRLRQVLLNLIGNAVKFTESGYIKLCANQKASENQIDLILAVEDSGIGISSDQHNLIFESFRQQDGQSTRQYGGTGLGLTITKRLVEIMNGQISLSSVPGEGSRFEVTLRGVKIATTMPDTKKNTHFALNNVKFEKVKILVVDDIESNRNLIEEYLSKVNLEVILAENGHKALLFAEKYHPALILMDIRMPEMDGYEAIKLLKNNPNTTNIPIIAVTASVTFNAKTKIKTHGFDGYLAKPVNFSELLGELSRYLKYMPETVANREVNHTFNLNDIVDFPILRSKIEQEIMPLWEDANTVIETEVITKLANQLIELGNEHNVPIFVNHGELLQEYLQTFNITDILEILKHLSNIIKKLINHEE